MEVCFGLNCRSVRSARRVKDSRVVLSVCCVYSVAAYYCKVIATGHEAMVVLLRNQIHLVRNLMVFDKKLNTICNKVGELWWQLANTELQPLKLFVFRGYIYTRYLIS